jgi:chorismate synthase
VSSIFGKNFTIDIFGESHGSNVGVVIGGLPSGVQLDIEKIQAFMDRRRSGGEAWSTKRKETDIPRIVSGFYNGKTTGTPLSMLLNNADTKSKDYQEGINRPGHADYTGNVRYNGCNDPRGGGHFSGRLTAPLVFAGAVAAQILESKGIYAATHISQIAGVLDKPFDNKGVTVKESDVLKSSRFALNDAGCKEKMLKKIEEAASLGDSVGGEIECAVMGVPAGIGNPMMSGIESRLSSLVFAIPAVKAVSFGAGSAFAAMKGSEANDAYELNSEGITAKTNNNGGIIGGISNGMPIVFRAVIKPTPSISLPQQTVNLTSGEQETLKVKGRHDPCIVPRAVPVVEAAACICILDMMMERGL